MTTAETTTARLCPKCERPTAKNGRCYPCARKSNRKCKACGAKLAASGRCFACKPQGYNEADVAAILAHRKAHPHASVNRIAKETGYSWGAVRQALTRASLNGTGHDPAAEAENIRPKPTRTSEELVDEIKQSIDPLDRVNTVLIALDGLAPAQAEKVLAVAARAVRLSR